MKEPYTERPIINELTYSSASSPQPQSLVVSQGIIGITSNYSSSAVITLKKVDNAFVFS